MRIISPTQLRNEQKKYLELAETEKVVVKRGNKLIHLVVSDRLITDEDLERGITGSQLLNRVIPRIEELFNK